ncbi:pancreatic triacylglycerol lipase [Amia ocellicauda]|uniref:pancreatic triacylglycerol lipase n=1 Tax=Amia ocellicauda TaxID=2972642 RepID=UPI00346445E1
MIAVWTTLVLCLTTVAGEEVCYDRLGCFGNDRPWAGTIQRPISRLPWSPERINTRFLLFTRQNPNSYQDISAVIPSTISASNFRTNLKTRFIIHGFIDKADELWVEDMCKALLQEEDVNCICVDWLGGSRCPYTQAANNIRVVGAEIAYFAEVLQTNYNYHPSNIHLIGHSLGAHASGEAGKRKHGISRITGLDPAEPYFQNTPIEVRLDPSDAVFVDVIHTDAAPMVPYLGFGMMQAVGHVDFYPNGGKEMPGCNKNIMSDIVDINGIWEGTRNFVACNHARAYKYYIDSIKERDGLIGYQCSNYEDFKKGNCAQCMNGGCPLMGHYADTYELPNGAVNQLLYLNTGDAVPYSRWRYIVSVKVAGNQDVRGLINISLFANEQNTRQHEITKGKLEPTKMYISGFDSEVNLGDLTEVKFLWDNSEINPLLPTLGAETVTVQRAQDGKLFRFCGSGTVQEKVLQTLTLC